MRPLPATTPMFDESAVNTTSYRGIKASKNILKQDLHLGRFGGWANFGIHTFQFAIVLPSNLPSSMEVIETPVPLRALHAAGLGGTALRRHFSDLLSGIGHAHEPDTPRPLPKCSRRSGREKVTFPV